MTRVVSVRGRKRAELEADPNFEYVGRAVRFTTWTERSPFANPFYQGITLEKAFAIMRPVKYLPSVFQSPVELFHEWLLCQPDLMAKLPRLRGKTLGCWCGTWTPGQPDIGCHAVVLARLANATEVA